MPRATPGGQPWAWAVLLAGLTRPAASLAGKGLEPRAYASQVWVLSLTDWSAACQDISEGPVPVNQRLMQAAHVPANICRSCCIGWAVGCFEW